MGSFFYLVANWCANKAGLTPSFRKFDKSRQTALGSWTAGLEIAGSWLGATCQVKSRDGCKISARRHYRWLWHPLLIFRRQDPPEGIPVRRIGWRSEPDRLYGNRVERWKRLHSAFFFMRLNDATVHMGVVHLLWHWLSVRFLAKAMTRNLGWFLKELFCIGVVCDVDGVSEWFYWLYFSKCWFIHGTRCIRYPLVFF